MKKHTFDHGADLRTPIQRHGYVFAALYGLVFVSLAWAGALAVGVDPNVSMRATYTTGFLSLFLVGLGIAAVLAYVGALALSDACYRIRCYLKARLK